MTDYSTVAAMQAVPATMRAAAIIAPGRVELADLQLPQPGSREVRVRLEGCGVCASNLPLWEGREWFTYPHPPGAPGHEGWGSIDAIGSEVEDFKPGDRVALLSYRAYAEYDTAVADAVVRLPESLNGQPFPGEALGCAFNVFRRCNIEPGQTVAVVGIGFLGALLVRLASNAGARVIAISRRRFALDLATRFGADDVVPMDDHWRIIERVKMMTGGHGCECVIEVTGHQWPLDLAAELTRERGRLVIAGYHQDGSRQVNMQLWNWRGLDVTNAHERDPQVYLAGIRAAVEAVASATLDPSSLYTHRFRLDQLGEALETMRRRPDGFLKAVISI
jgi:threonine dehydrogenase-like Zn-dependent dehydrogenase